MSSKTLLIIGFVWPEPNSSAAGIRMLQLINLFIEQGFEITFVTAANHSDKTFDLSSIGVKTQTIELNNPSFDIFVKELNPDIVLFDRFMTEEQFGWRVTEQCPNTLRVLDTEDFHGLRKGRELALKADEEFSISYLQNNTTKREIASLYRCDLSLIISEVEKEILTQQFKIDASLLYYLPFLIEPIIKSEIAVLPSFESREHFITIGNFLHPPNFDAIQYLKKTIWPLIKTRLPNAEMHVYGAYESQKITQLNDKKDGFLIKGYTKDVNEVMQKAKVCLAPLRYGAGLKGKLFDAIQNGTPSVMSTIAAEGLFGRLEANGFIEDNPDAFATKAVALYENSNLWGIQQQLGFKTLNERFNSAAFKTNFKNKITDLSENKDHYRQHNFTGQLLMHHTLQSTKYMSKWIEEKNS